MKVLFIIILLFPIYLYSQELNIGGNIGTNLEHQAVILGGNVEFRPVKSFFSLNFDPSVLLYTKRFCAIFPLYFKLIIGEKIRFCPEFGAFIRTYSSYGWFYGIHIEFKIKERTLLFLNSDCIKEYYEAEAPSHYGPSSIYTETRTSLWFSAGIKRNIFK
jgi:hypothetical protein